MNAAKIHFARPPPLKEIERLLAGGTREFHMPKSCQERLSKRVAKKISEKGGKIIYENSRGRPIGLGMERILEVIELHNDNRTYRQIEDITGIPKSTVHYLIKYAGRNKIRKGGKTVYL